jgi:hypothetical protein
LDGPRNVKGRGCHSLRMKRGPSAPACGACRRTRCAGHGRDRRRRRASAGSRSYGWCATVVGSRCPGESVRGGPVPSRRQRVAASAAGVARAVRPDGSGRGNTHHRGRGFSINPARRRHRRCHRSQRRHARTRRRVCRGRDHFPFARCVAIAEAHHVNLGYRKVVHGSNPDTRQHRAHIGMGIGR